jgi:photosystem II Psb27 protein
MKRFLSCVLSLVLVVSVLLTGCSSSSSASLTGNFSQDTLALISSLRTAIAAPDDDPEKPMAQADARAKINDFIALYRRDDSLTSLGSFTTMRTALNSLAGHYSSYPNRPLPDKLKVRLEQEFKQVEQALSRESAA